ncbi:MAG: TetR/AcrR family transcriptional regulator, partial [Angelakisella sp.]
MNNMNEKKVPAKDAPVDRRTKRTKRALRQGLAVLLLKKSLKDISVRELTDAVDLHRGTFYAHYRDIFDLYASIEAEIIEEVNEILDEYLPECVEVEPFPVILALIEYMYENADI